jgi:hypothetical protein
MGQSVPHIFPVGVIHADGDNHLSRLALVLTIIDPPEFGA